jgi:16S rRNA (cytosine1402-N4)-methyltransferase
VPVLLRQTVDALAAVREPWLVDCTLGGGGHTEALLRALPSARVVGIDRDPDALEHVEKRLMPEFRGRLSLVHASFAELPQVVQSLPPLGAVLADLGCSSWQLDEPGRGFSFRSSVQALDMRFDQRLSSQCRWYKSRSAPLSEPLHCAASRWGASDGSGHLLTGDTMFPPGSPFTAAQLLAWLPVPTIARVLSLLGDERASQSIAERIGVLREEVGPVGMLSVSPATLTQRAKIPRGSLARVFMALRIAVNNEFGHLLEFLCSAPALLAEEGRLAVITFHSLEDVMVATAFRALCAAHGESFFHPRLQGGRRDVSPASAEVAENSRSRSSRLRLLQRRAGSVDRDRIRAVVEAAFPRGVMQRVELAGVVQDQLVRGSRC